MERMRIIAAAVILVAVIATIAVIAVQPTEEGELGDSREYYSGDYNDYYGPFGLGPTYATGCEGGLINEVLDLRDLEMPDQLPIYTLRPPPLETREQAEEYLAGFNYNVSGWGYRWEDFFEPGHVFSFDRRTSIVVLMDGAVIVETGIESPEWRLSNITIEEAEAVALSYLESHTGVPEYSEMKTSHDNPGDSYGNRWITRFLVRMYRSVEGYPVEGWAISNQILITINAHTGKVIQLKYSWTALERTDTVGLEALGDLEEIVSDYITAHNNRYSGGLDQELRNVTSVDIILRPSFGTSTEDMYEGSPSYVYLPFVSISYGRSGLAYMPPLAEGIVE